VAKTTFLAQLPEVQPDPTAIGAACERVTVPDVESPDGAEDVVRDADILVAV